VKALAEGGALPIGAADGGRIELFCNGRNQLFYRIIEGDIDGSEQAQAGELRFLAELPGRPILVETRTKGLIRIMLQHQPDQYITYETAAAAQKAAGTATAVAGTAEEEKAVSAAEGVEEEKEKLTATEAAEKAGAEKAGVRFVGERPEMGEMRLVAGEVTTLYGTVEAVGLSGKSSGRSGSQLTDADNRLLTNAMTAAYSALKQQAHELGYCAQPIVARYRLQDVAGNTIAIGPTTVLAAPCGFAATDPVVLTSNDALQTLNEGSMALTVFRPAIIAPAELPAPWDSIVSKVTIEVTEELDPLDSALQAPHRVQRNEATGVITISSRLPGFSLGMVLDSSRFRTLVMQGLTAPRYIVAEYNRPYGGGIATPGNQQTFQAVNPTTPTTLSIATPAIPSRSYSAATETAGLTALCNPLTAPFYGWAPDSFIAATATNSTGALWKMAFSVKLTTPAGESWLKREISCQTASPANLLPLLCYPSTDATELQISYKAPDGTAYQQSYPLTAIPATGLAVYISPNLARITLTQQADSYAPRGDQQTATLQNGQVDILSYTDLGNILDSLNIYDHPIHAVRALPRGQSGWDFSRRKLVFFGEGGTALATLTSAGQFSAATIIDHRPVLNADAICQATANNGAAIVALAGDDLVELSGQKVSTLQRSLLRQLAQREPTPILQTGSLGWDDRFCELWLALGNLLYRMTADGELIKANYASLTATADEPYRFANYDGNLLLGCATATYNLSNEDPDTPVTIGLRVRYQVSTRPEWLTLNVFGSNLTGEFTLKGDRGTEIPEQLLRLKINGDLNAPLTMRLASPYRPYLETNLSLTAGADLAIHD
jgi:hypothetical protein